MKLYVWQRGSAMLMLPMILVHLAVIFYAMGQKLTAQAILARTQGSIAWALFYGLFVVLASIHASIGLRNVLCEWAGFRDPVAWRCSIFIALLLLVLGLFAVTAVTLPEGLHP